MLFLMDDSAIAERSALTRRSETLDVVLKTTDLNRVSWWSLGWSFIERPVGHEAKALHASAARNAVLHRGGGDSKLAGSHANGTGDLGILTLGTR